MESRAWTYILSLPEGPSQPSQPWNVVGLRVAVYNVPAWCVVRPSAWWWPWVVQNMLKVNAIFFSIVLFLLPIWHIDRVKLVEVVVIVMVVRLLWINVTRTVWSFVWKVYGRWGGMAPSWHWHVILWEESCLFISHILFLSSIKWVGHGLVGFPNWFTLVPLRSFE